jgi:hypothetical protein
MGSLTLTAEDHWFCWKKFTKVYAYVGSVWLCEIRSPEVILVSAKTISFLPTMIRDTTVTKGIQE